MADPAIGGRGDAEDLLGFRGQPLDPGEDGFEQRLGQHRAPLADAERDKLLGEVGVAAGAGEDAVEHLVGGRAVEQVAELDGQFLAPEAGQLDSLRPAVAPLVGQELPHGRVTVELVAAVGDAQHGRLITEIADQERQQVEGRTIDPVQVLDGEQHRRLPAQLGQDPEDVVEQAGLPEGRRPTSLALFRAELEKTRQLGLGRGEQATPGGLVEREGEGPAGFDHRTVGQPTTAQLDAMTEHHPDVPGGGPPHELVEQKCLADSRLATEEHDHRRAERGRADG